MRSCGLALLALVSVACGPPAKPPALGDLALPAAPGSLAPFLDAGPEGFLRAAWLDPLPTRGHAVRVASHDGTTWSVPVTVASGEALLANWADTPTIRDLGGGRLAVSWPVQQPDGGHGYDLAVAFSSDGGTSWGAPVRPHSDGTGTEHGFPAFGELGVDGVALAWLDGRAYASGEESTAAMSLRFARVALDGGVSGERVLDARTCDCCPTSAASTPEGLAVVYRDRSDGGELRDVALVRELDGGWTAPSLVHADGWEIAGCPVNGPAIDSVGERVAVAWFTLAGGVAATRVAFSPDGGATFGPPLRFDEGAPTGRVALAWLDETSAAAAWIEDDDLRLRRVGSAGLAGPPSSLATLPPGRQAGMPRLVAWRGGLVAAWTAPGEPGRVRVEGVAIPPG